MSADDHIERLFVGFVTLGLLTLCIFLLYLLYRFLIEYTAETLLISGIVAGCLVLCYVVGWIEDLYGMIP